MTEVVIYAPNISTFGRIVAMTAAEKGLTWRIVPTDPKTPEHRARHPFEKSPAVEIGNVHLFESDAICRYIDEGFEGPPLQPEHPIDHAHMTKWMSVTQHYIFPSTEYGLVMPRIVVPMMGREPDESRITAALPTIAYQLGLVEGALANAPFIAGDRLSLADLYLYCCWKAVSLTPEGKRMLGETPATARWLDFIAARPSAEATRWPGE